MRWMHYLFWGATACVVLVAQSALAPVFELGGARPDWILVCVVFVALHATETNAIVISALVGLAADFLTIERPGLLAVSYTAAAGLILGIREYLFVRQMLTQVVLTLGLGLVLRTGWLAYRHALYTLDEPIVKALVLNLVPGSAYTALWTPLLHWPFLRLLGAFGLSRPRGLESIPIAQRGSRV